jgi:hypothetical protein
VTIAATLQAATPHSHHFKQHRYRRPLNLTSSFTLNMFRLLNSGLPRDPEFPSNLEELGSVLTSFQFPLLTLHSYFVNPDDEIRSISNSNAYFNYFITNNDRVNDAQREGFNGMFHPYLLDPIAHSAGAVRKIVLGRLHSLDLKTLTLPLGTAEIDPHIPILVSTNLEHKKRVTILFYEHNQDLGILAHRVIGGPGGIDKGSAVNLVKYIQSQGDIGVILANLGQLRWWHRGGKAVSHTSWQALPRPSAVSAPPNFNLDLNTVPKNRTPEEHVECIFKQVLKYLCHFDARFDIIGVSDGATTTVKFLNEGQNWVTWGPRINAVALLASSHHQDEISNPEFAAWLRKVCLQFPLDILFTDSNSGVEDMLRRLRIAMLLLPVLMAVARIGHTAALHSASENHATRNCFSQRVIEQSLLGSNKSPQIQITRMKKSNCQSQGIRQIAKTWRHSCQHRMEWIIVGGVVMGFCQMPGPQLAMAQKFLLYRLWICKREVRILKYRSQTGVGNLTRKLQILAI